MAWVGRQAGFVLAAAVAVTFMGTASAAKRELLVDVPNTSTKDLYIEVGQRWSGEGMKGRDGRIYSGKSVKKPLFWVTATCSISGDGGDLPVRQISMGKSEMDEEAKHVDLDQQPIGFLVLSHRKLCGR